MTGILRSICKLYCDDIQNYLFFACLADIHNSNVPSNGTISWLTFVFFGQKPAEFFIKHMVLFTFGVKSGAASVV
jgi:hypothetical protein